MIAALPSLSSATAPHAVPLHFRRLELKYLLPDRAIANFVRRVTPYTQPDPFLISEGAGRTAYPVTSLYFDSIDLQSLREKESGLLSRRKVRLRTYREHFGEEFPCFMEIKRRHDFVVSKDRLSLARGCVHVGLPMHRLLGDLLRQAEADDDVRREAQLLHGWYSLQPTAVVRYHRHPLVGIQDRRFRITIDSQLSGVWRPRSLLGRPLLSPVHPGWSVVEVKCNHAIPAWFHDILREFQFVRTAHSKYATVVEGLRPRG